MEMVRLSIIMERLVIKTMLVLILEMTSQGPARVFT